MRRDAIECERLNRLHPDRPKKVPYVQQVLGNDANVPVVASSDYMRAVPEQVAPYLNNRLLALGTDGFGRSETRANLRRFFEVDAEHVAVAALHALAERGQLDRGGGPAGDPGTGHRPGAAGPVDGVIGLCRVGQAGRRLCAGRRRPTAGPRWWVGARPPLRLRAGLTHPTRFPPTLTCDWSCSMSAS